ncbi:hypothetical protein [Ammoniphilus sp. 3BR4]|uniref:hypothetical protein n=1 Tax=Ammoniphilus sp. 3BR4 TaxID=3158265 RepID=UPI00346650D9
MIEDEKDGMVYPSFSPNDNPFVSETKEVKSKLKSMEKKISNDIFDDDDSGDYASLHWNE